MGGFGGEAHEVHDAAEQVVEEDVGGVGRQVHVGGDEHAQVPVRKGRENGLRMVLGWWWWFWW